PGRSRVLGQMRRRRQRRRGANRGRERQGAILARAPHPQRRVRCLAVVVIDPLPKLREHRLGIAQLGVTEIIALERPYQRLRQAVALWLYAGVVIGTKPSSWAYSTVAVAVYCGPLSESH